MNAGRELWHAFNDYGCQEHLFNGKTKHTSIHWLYGIKVMADNDVDMTPTAKPFVNYV